MNKSIIGWILILFGIATALVGTWFYQSAISGVINQIELYGLPGAYILNMQYMGIMVMSGVLLVIIGVGLTISNKMA